MNNCAFCGNEHLKNTSSEYTYKNNHQYMIVNNVPCQQCEFCGEKYYDADVLKKIESEFFAIKNGKVTVHTISVPVEDYQTLDVA